MTPPRPGRTFALALAAVCALAVADVSEVSGQGLPQVPQVQLPALPKAPALQPPSQLRVPETPRLPSAPLPRVQAPTPSLPGAPSAPGVSLGGGVVPGASGNGPPSARGVAPPVAGTPGGGAPRADGGAAARTRARRGSPGARTRPAPTRRELRFRRAVEGLWACSYAISGFERRVLVRRAGLESFSPASSTAVANRLRVSVARVRRAERTGVRRLRGANRSDRCAMGSPSEALSETVRALQVVAAAPPLATVESLARADAPASPDSQGQTLGDQQASTDTPLKRSPQTASTVPAAAGTDGSLPWLLILILSLMAIAASVPLLLRRRGERNLAPARPADPAPPLEQAMPAPVARAPEPTSPIEPEPEPEPPPRPPPSFPIAPAPWTDPGREPPEDTGPAARSAPAPPAEGEQHHDAVQPARTALAGVASLAVGLMLRARRRR